MLNGVKQAWWTRQVRLRGGEIVRFERVRYQNIASELADAGVDVRPYQVDVARFEQYASDADYASRPYYEHGKHPNARQKWLEHFVSIDLLGIQAGDVVIDIASSESPFPEIVEALHQAKTYRQDWVYPKGLNGREIGGDASAMPIEDEFADKLVMHCSFEHFEGDRDSAFIREAARVLRPGGRLCILPLYTNHDYCVQTDPAGWKKHDPRFEADAPVCVTHDWGESHGRFYSADKLVERVVQHLGDLSLTMHSIENLKSVGSECYLRLAALFEKRGAA